jgi:hypothetical protein
MRQIRLEPRIDKNRYVKKMSIIEIIESVTTVKKNKEINKSEIQN